jgi:hypothetical protein
MRTKTVTLCGSTRFIDVISVCGWLIERDERALTFGLHLLPGWYPNCPPHHLAEQEGVADQMDALHLEKISRSDEIFVVDFDNYIGSSTLSEIAHAKARDIPVRYFSSDPIGTKCRALGALSKQSSASEVHYAFSVEEMDTFQPDLFAALVDSGITPNNGEVYEVMRGRCENYSASAFLSPTILGNILGSMDSNSDLEVGESADDWPGTLSQHEEQRLMDHVCSAVDSWAEKLECKPGFYRIVDVADVRVRILDAEKQKFEVIE